MTAVMEDQTLVEALRTVAVNGSYNASRALSKWLRRGVRLTSEEFRRLTMGEASSIFGEPDATIAAVHMPLAGELDGHLLLAFPDRVALLLAGMLLQQPEGTATTFEELEQSSLQETGNIVGTAYANSLARWLRLRIAPTVPTFVYDMACAIIDPLIMELCLEQDEVYVSETEFTIDGRRMQWCLLLMPSMTSVARMRDRCRLDVVRRQAMQTIAVNGAFNASWAMSKWLKRGVKIATDGFSRVPLVELGNRFDPLEPIVALHMPLGAQLHGHALLALSVSHAKRLVDLVMGQPPGATTEIGELEQSCLAETGNIISSSFVNSWSTWLDLHVEPASPEYLVDLPGAILDGVMAEQAQVSDKAFAARTDFNVDDQTIEWAFMLVPAPSAMRLIETTCQ